MFSSIAALLTLIVTFWFVGAVVLVCFGYIGQPLFEYRGVAQRVAEPVLARAASAKAKCINQAVIFEPFLATMLLTALVWLYMYGRRLPFIFSAGLQSARMTPTELARLSPPSVSNPSDNLKNLFELPTLFYAIVLYLYVVQQVDKGYLIAAWGFFVFRVLHSLVHCTFNFIPLRFVLYVISAAGLWFMIIRAVLAAISS